MSATVDAPRDSNVVRIWRVSIADAPVASLAALLSDDERARAARFVFDRDRNQFIVVRGYLRQLLGAYLRRSPRELRFVLGAQGKPTLAGQSGGLHFNVSHSRDVGLLAFTRGREVGVDVEQTDARVEIEALAERSFSPAERATLRHLRGAAQVDRFFQLWTAKEAYIKAVGGGLSIPLSDFTVDVRVETDAWTVTTSDETTRPAPLSVRRIAVPTGYAGAVASAGNDWDVEIRDLAHDLAHDLEVLAASLDR